MGRCLFTIVGITIGLMMPLSAIKAETLQNVITHVIETKSDISASMVRLLPNQHPPTPKLHLPKLYDNSSFDKSTIVNGLLQLPPPAAGRTVEQPSVRLPIGYDNAENIALKTIDVYLKAVLAERMVELARESLLSHNQIYDQITQQIKNGDAYGEQLRQIQTRRASANAVLTSTINRFARSYEEFYRLVNRQPIDLSKPPVDDKLFPSSLEEAITVAAQSNPHLQAASREIRFFENLAEEMEDNSSPQLDFEVGQIWDESQSELIPPNEDADLSVVLNFSYNLYGGNSDQTRHQVAARKVEEAKLARALAYQNIVSNLSMAWQNFTFQDERIVHLADRVAAARKVNLDRRQRFLNGNITLLDLLHSETELFQSQWELAQTLHRKAFARYRILHGTGRLLDSMNIELATTAHLENYSFHNSSL